MLYFPFGDKMLYEPWIINSTELYRYQRFLDLFHILFQESESEEEGLDEVDEDVEEEHENETDTAVEVEPIVTKPPETPLAPKDTERQLSKKELKKKGLEELDALLAEMGLKNETSGQDGSHGTLASFICLCISIGPF